MASATKSDGVDDLDVCMANHPIASKGGIWLGNNPLDYPYSLMLAQIIVVLLSSRLLYYFLKPLGQTKFVCNLLGGIITGSSVFGGNRVMKDKLFEAKIITLFDTLAILGIVYSIFLATLKFDVVHIKRSAKDALKVGLVSFLLPTAVASSVLYLLGGHIQGFGVGPGGKFFMFYATTSLSLNYFPVIAQAMEELNLMTSELGQIAMSSAMLNDVIQWFLSALQLIFLQKNVTHGLESLISFLAFIFFIVYIIRPVIRSIINNTPEGKEVKQIYVVAIQLGVIVVTLISDAIGMRAIMGPFILGLVIPGGPPLGTTLVQKTELLVSEFLLPVFFYRIGYSTNVHSIRDWTSFSKLQIIITVAYVVKIVGVVVAALWCKVGLKHGLMLSMAMSIKGIIEIIVYGRWRKMQLIDDQTFTQLVLSMLGFTMLVTPLLHFSYNSQARLRSSTRHPRLRSIQSMPSTSETFRILCCFHVEESIRNIITLLEASNPTEESPICAYIIHAVKLMGSSVPTLVPYKKLRRTNTPNHQMMRAFEQYSEKSRGPVTIQAYNMVAPYKTMHETIFRLANDKVVPLIIIPFHDHRGMVEPGLLASIHQFNVNVQANSPCTVGILVDRGMTCRLSLTQFSYNVGVFFVGGPDDREALAYAARMSGNQDVEMTVVRFILRNNKLKVGNVKEQTEAKLDESVIEEFKLRNNGNDRLDWRDIEVDDGIQVMNSIRNLQGEHDLVMVGRRHVEMPLRDEEMAAFVEHAELGVMGDMLASSDFCGGMVNVLVMQESRELGCGAFHSDSLPLQGSQRLP